MIALLCARRPAYSFGVGLLLAVMPLSFTAARAQTDPTLDAIHAAEQQHRPPAEVGAMWAHLAVQYGSTAQFLKAEDAYNHSLHLLKDVPAARPLYGEALDNLASLYLTYGRIDEAESVRKQGLTIRQQLGNLADVGVSEVHIADIAIARHDYKKAERFALQGLKDMETSASPPSVGVLSALITVTYARCLQGHAGEGLASGQQAYDFAGAHFAPESPAIGFALQTLGFAQWKNGDGENGGTQMQRALDMLRRHLVPSDPRLAGALMQYENYLSTEKRRPEAAAIREEVARMHTRTADGCPACTVSVYSLAKGLR